MEVVSLANALAQGLKRFFTGKPCKYGHVCERFASSGSCIQCVYSRQCGRVRIFTPEQIERRNAKLRVKIAVKARNLKPHSSGQSASTTSFHPQQR